MGKTDRSDDIVVLSAQLRLSVTRLARQLRQTSDQQLTPTQVSVLATIWRHGSLTLGELAEGERVAAPTISKVAGVLADKGLIERNPDPEDRRFIRVELTTEGHALLERSRSRRTAWLTQRLRQLSDDEFDRLQAAADVFDKLTDTEEFK